MTAGQDLQEVINKLRRWGMALESVVPPLQRAMDENNRLRAALEMLVERVERPPEPNCSCHISPPCNDCVDHAGAREAFEFAESALQREGA